MMKKTLSALFAVLLLVFQPFGGITNNAFTAEAGVAIGVQRRTSAVPSDFGRLEVFPSYADLTYSREFRFDLRCRDISDLDLSDKFEALMYSDFDSSTKWPETLPEGFSPEHVMELGKDPGLDVRKLHEQGIDGSGVGIAIIDQVLFTEHSEYADRLMHYEEIPYLGDDSRIKK